MMTDDAVEAARATQAAYARLWIELAVRSSPSLAFEALACTSRRALAAGLPELHDASFQRVIIGSGHVLGVNQAE